MPYLMSEQTCKQCGESNKLFRNRWNKKNQRFYLQRICKQCELDITKNHQKNNREYWRELNSRYYYKTSESVVSRRNVLDRTLEDKKQQARDKANRRCSRAKLARQTDEFTNFVTAEAHDLRKLRDKLTGISWHVDHIVPLNGKDVCGLHIWCNLAVIPKLMNLRKGNKHAIHVRGPEGLSKRERGLQQQARTEKEESYEKCCTRNVDESRKSCKR